MSTLLDDSVLEAFSADLGDEGAVFAVRSTYAALLREQEKWTAIASPLPDVLRDLVGAYRVGSDDEQRALQTAYLHTQVRLDLADAIVLQLLDELEGIEVCYLAALHAAARIAMIACAAGSTRGRRASSAMERCESYARSRGEHIVLTDPETWPAGARRSTEAIVPQPHRVAAA